jgi:hypothetical protein
MYVNPQGISYSQKKSITQQRTKGGFVLQYWGEELGTISINGTTGSSGIEGINVLEDVYRSEQLAFDPFALAIAAEKEDQEAFGDLPDASAGALLGNLVGLTAVSGKSMISNMLETGSTSASRPKPTMASLAFTVELYWSGWVFRGYFTDFKVDEKSSSLGLFDYTMNFTYTQRRGLRLNFLPWHRSATHGQSNSSPPHEGGIPYSYEELESLTVASKQMT